MTFEQFMAQFTAHIEGTATNEREAHESADEAGDVKASQQLNSNKKGTDPNKASSKHLGENDSIEHELRSQASKKSGSLAASKFGSINA